MLPYSYDTTLMLISLMVAMLASYTALNMVERVHTTRGRAARMWFFGGAFSMGVGIWSMHFIGMLAFQLPISLGYDLLKTLISLLLAVAVSGFALWLVAQATLPLPRLLMGALVMGAGIAGMHYTGMAAMEMQPGISFIPRIFALSLLIAVAASGAALWIFFKLRGTFQHLMLAKLVAAVVMGIAIAGMHYTGMAAAEFPLGSICGAARDGFSLDSIAVMVVMGTLCILAIALMASILDARLETQTAKLAKDLTAANLALQKQALHDNLTSLPNRTLLEDRVEQALHKARRNDTRFGLLFMDLDGFKAVNDSLGHHVGDALLVEMANRIKKTLRAQDTLARMGGDEFVALIEGISYDNIAFIAQKLIQAVNQQLTLDGHQLHLSASIGIAVYPEDGESYRDLSINADAAMYHTKRGGRNGYHFFDTSMNMDAKRKMDLLVDLRSALKRKQLKLHYQAKFDTQSGEMTGAEALLRWQHPRLGMIPPDQFIPLAEKSGLMIVIGEWVLNEACSQMREWYDMGHAHMKMAVNLSAMQFSHSNLFNVITDTLARWQLPPSSLIIEVTESTAMHDVKSSLDILQKIADLGVDISIDDFGTGYSSLLYLKKLPATELKIDRGFIANLSKSGNAEDAAIISAIIGLGHTLNLRVVAEGVETVEQQNFLKSMGCDVLQGFLLARPLPPDEISLSNEHLVKAA